MREDQWMWELDYKEGWALKNWCFWTVVLEKTLESPLDYKEIKSVHPKGNQSWIFIGRTDAEDESPILWPPDGKNWLFGKYPDAGKYQRQEEKGDNRRWDGWMASLTLWTWVWVSSRSWWCTGKPGVLQYMGSPRLGHDWTTEQQFCKLSASTFFILLLYLFLAVLDLHCYTWAFSGCDKQGLLFLAVHELRYMASLVSEHSFRC